MKNIIIFCLAALPLGLVAQDKTAAVGIHFLLGHAKFEAGVPTRYAGRVEQQLLGTFTQGGETIGGPFSAFVITPTVAILENGKIEGIQTRQTVKLNLNLTVTNALTGEVFGTADQFVVGSGATQDEAVNKALVAIRGTNPGIQKSVEGFKTKIAAYYNDHCADVKTAAEAKEKEKDYQGALALLHSIPQGTACYAGIEDKKTALFNQVQARNCETLLQRADAQIAAKNYTGALFILSTADTQAPCAADVKQRIATVEVKLDAEQQKQYEWLFKFWSAGAEAEKAHWNAISALCLNWLRTSGKSDYVR